MPFANTMIPRQTTVRAPNEKSKKSLRAKSMPSSGRSAGLPFTRWRKSVSPDGALRSNSLRPRKANASPRRCVTSTSTPTPYRAWLRPTSSARRSMAPLAYGSTRDQSKVETKSEGEASKLPMPWKSSSRPLGSRSWSPAADLRKSSCGSWYLKRSSRSPTPKVSPLVLPVRVGPLEKDRAERLGGALEDLQLGIEAVGEAGRGGHHRDGAGRRVRDHVRERIEGRAARQPDRLRGARQPIAQRDGLGARGSQPEQHRNANPTRQVSHAAPPLAVAERGGLPR